MSDGVEQRHGRVLKAGEGAGQNDILPNAKIDELSLTTEPTPFVTGLNAFQYAFQLTGLDTGCATITIRDEADDLIKMAFDRASGRVEFDRLLSSRVETAELQRHVAAHVVGDTLTVWIVIDGPSVEIFLNGGRIVYTATVFPAGDIQITGEAGSGHWRVAELAVSELQATMFIPA